MWRFIERYGWDAYQNAYWKTYTRDGVIPFKLFVLACASLRHTSAEDELVAAHAGIYAQAVAWGGAKDPKLRRHARALIRTAFPEDVRT